MTHSKLFTVFAAIAGSIWATCAQAADSSRLHDRLTSEDSLKPKQDTVILTPEELALLVEYIPNEPDEVIQDRLSCIESEIPLEFNKFVRGFIDYFTIRNRKYTRTMLTRENVYFPLFEKYLKKYDMPQELKYLSIVESGLNPKAKSHAGAVGLWQFMGATGKEYGLEQNQYIDERMDPEKSTDSALRFLRRLHKTYGDWELAMAAYNCGPGNVNKAIRRAGGGKKTFWEVFPYLPRETRSYVPSMTAVIYAMNYATEHNIFSDSILYEPKVGYLEVKQALDLEKLAGELHITPDELMALNPELKKTNLPDHMRNYKLRIPANRSVLLASEADQSCILLAAAPTPPSIREAEHAQAPVLLASAKTEPEEEKKKTEERVTYTVQAGDNLHQIAKRHNVTVADLKEWNNLEDSNIRPHQKLFVLQAPAASNLLASNEGASKAPSKPASGSAAEKARKEPDVYHVQPGDTLWTISQKHNGLTVEQIKKLNKLKSNNIKPGQKLILS
ncbi:MAG: LysM peptidoglycan-binding domain-containing protein [Hymenobacteraceae bacterium]|nr:LysM peptidoglycan-binding domain-containing protein [Hymenobacteraceae bacterium]MDX5481085.1 LysM peptidoglycan-binding domain-containing protein [Hymenobacteraceae bacterium]